MMSESTKPVLWLSMAIVYLLVVWMRPVCALAAVTNRQVLVRDITTIAGIRDNPLVGYGLVVGLRGTGDSQQTIFTVQTLANAMQKMGVLIPPSTSVVKNVAAVFITATLPPFSRPGERLDITVGSIGDAHNLEGGVLLMSALHGPDGKVYAEAQGSLIMGGYFAGTGSNGKQVNPTNVGLIPGGGIVERDTAVDISDFKTVSLLLRNPDFNTATEIANAVNTSFHKPVASALDSSRVDINVVDASELSVPLLIARVQSLVISVHTPAKILINERTGTIVMGGDVKLSPVSVIHGSLSIEVVTSYTPVQPMGVGFGPPVLVPQTSVNVSDGPAQSMKLEEGANVDELVNGLHSIGLSAHDVVSILQAIKAEGGLQAELEVQ
jgi:flagellar P-ring protein FlgI